MVVDEREIRDVNGLCVKRQEEMPVGIDTLMRYCEVDCFGNRHTSIAQH